MFICTDQLDDSYKSIVVECDKDGEHPIMLKVKLGGYATRFYLSRDEALDIMSQIEKAVHETAEKEIV